MTDSSELLQAQLARVALGDQTAFKQLYDMTSAHLYAIVLRIVRKSEVADEILQESFINIWHHAAQYNPARSKAMTWLISIVRNKALDWARAAQQQHETTSHDDEIDIFSQIVDERPHSLELLEKASHALAIADCMQELDANHRQSLALAYFNGLSHSEVAEHLRMPLGTVKSWIKRGLARLKLCLEFPI